MNIANDGGPAFPSHGSMGEVAHAGMTLRDWFAGQALAGMTANSSCVGPFSVYANDAYKYADAMLAARARK